MSRNVGYVLLNEQLVLLEEKKAEARELLDRGQDAHDEDLVHEIANDLAGIRFVILGALHGCAPSLWRDELEARELEARELLREVVSPASEMRAPDGIGGHLAGEIADQLVAAS